MQQGSPSEDVTWQLLHTQFVEACRKACQLRAQGAGTSDKHETDPEAHSTAQSSGLPVQVSGPWTHVEEEARVWSDITQRHSEPQRHYHTLEHLQAMMEWLCSAYAAQATYQDTACNPCSPHQDTALPNSRVLYTPPPHVVLAVLFHDCVYDPTAKDNEEQSACVAVRHLQTLHCHPGIIASVEQYILATKLHEVACDSQDGDLELFLDADLSILAADPLVYNQYSEGIRKEYSHLQDDEFLPGRHAVLTRLLQRPHLFFSQYAAHVGMRQKAIANLLRELQAIEHRLTTL